MRKIAAAAGLILAVLLITAPTALAEPGPKKEKLTKVKLLAFNDFHGHLEANTPGRIDVGFNATTNQTISVPAGGAEYFSTKMQLLGAASADTYVVTAGDMIGGSPLLSGLFHDEPTIELMNHVGLDMHGVGNHEFDEGKAELQRMAYGPAAPGARADGCHPVDECQDGTPFYGSVFQYLAANVIDKSTNNPLFPAYKIVNTSEGEKIAFVGETLEGTPTIVTPAGVAGLDFLDEADTINALVPRLKQMGVEAIVLLLHQGGFQNAPFSERYKNVDRCENFSGSEILDIVGRLDDEIDVVASAHTHDAYVCTNLGPKLVTSASSFGRVITQIDLTIDRRTGDVVTAAADNHVVTQNIPKDPVVTNLIQHYKTFADPIANRVVGSITADIRSSRSPGGWQTPSGEQEMGEVIADSQLAATELAHHGGSVVALMNPGGVRAHLLYNQISGGEQPGEVTYGEIFSVQPFGNSLVVKTCTGAKLEQILERQFVVNRILLPSWTLTYTWDAARPVGDRIDPTTIKIKGIAVDPAASYRITMNSFLADGGDGFVEFTQCTEPLGGEVDVDALGRWIGENSPVSPPPLNRITRLN